MEFDVTYKWQALGSFLAVTFGFLTVPARLVVAQSNIVPDQSLGTESSQVIPIVGGSTNEGIQGGARRGANLFHSFREFNIDAGRGAYFVNPAGVNRIFSRVTGNNPSNINGTVGVLGNSNLYLINPNGILFGPKSSLDLSGSFLASTAERITFPDDRDFSSQSNQDIPLLSVNVPIGMQWGKKLASVSLQDAKLVVEDQQSLLLFGGDISIQNSLLLAPDGHISLLSLSGPGAISLTSIEKGEFSANLDKAGIEIKNTVVSTNGSGNGFINIDAQNIEISNKSAIKAEIEEGWSSSSSLSESIILNASEKILITEGSVISNAVLENAVQDSRNIELHARSIELMNGGKIIASTRGLGNAGNVIIEAKDSVLISGNNAGTKNSLIINDAGKTATGNAGNIVIETHSLILEDRSFLSSSTLGEGDAGNIKISATGTVSILGNSDIGDQSFITSEVRKNGTGNGGAIDVKANSLVLKDKSFISATSLGDGNAGIVRIHIKDLLLIEEESRLISSSLSGATGDAGNIDVLADFLILKNGGFIGTNTSGIGNAGNISIKVNRLLLSGENGPKSFIRSEANPESTGNGGNLIIKTNSLSIKDGSFLSSSVLGQGKAGSVKINASESILLEGENRNSESSFISSRAGFSTQNNAGKIEVQARELKLKDGAFIDVSTFGTGQGGDVRLIADSLTLDQGSSISAITTSNRGGNIELDIDNLLLLRNSSLISATAGTSQANGDGGNIAIDTALLVAFPQENSDITANAFEGTGGNIQITTQGVFGIEFRNQLTPASDITASSNFGTDGTVQLDTSLDPTSGLVDLPVQPPQPQQVAQTCTPGSSAQSEFVYTGRGGLPPTSQQVLSQRNIDVGWVGLDANNDDERQRPSIANAQSVPPVESEKPQMPQLVEAQGWTTTQDGKVRLTASTTTAPHHLAQRVCPGA